MNKVSGAAALPFRVEQQRLGLEGGAGGEVSPLSRPFKRAFLNAYKAMLGCADCGRHEGRLDFDHEDKSEKRFKVGANVGYGWPAIRVEIEKCAVRCASCHARRHHQEDPPGHRSNNKHGNYRRRAA